MKILSIEPTPSPNSMKLNLDESLPRGVHKTYTSEQVDKSPRYIQQMLQISGVKSIFHTADFIAVDRIPKADWESILSQINEIFGTETNKQNEGLTSNSTNPDQAFGEANVLVQIFRGIPMQIRVKSGLEEARIALSERFTNAAMDAGVASPNLIRERTLRDWGVRYGDLQQIAEEVAQEIDAAYDDQRLALLQSKALEQGYDVTANPNENRVNIQISLSEVQEAFNHSDWKIRYAAFERMKATPEALLIIIKALKDAQSSIRRLAVVYLGDINTEEVLPYLYDALQDKSVSVRRTAGDTLSDIGNPKAIPAMIHALQDKNQLVRWRAARFLYEVGNETALEALRKAQNDSEFEVSMQVKIALARIEGGEAAEGTVWQQMMKRNQ